MRSMTARGRESAAARRVGYRGVAFLSVALIAFAVWAAPPAAPPPAPLPVDEAFPVTATLAAGKITVKFDVLPGHYLYRDRFEVQANGQAAGALKLPKGKIKNDPHFGRVEVYEQPLTLSVATKLAGTATVKVTFQGCSEIAGVCYPPAQRTFALTAGAQDVRPNEVPAISLGNQFRKQVSQ